MKLFGWALVLAFATGIVSCNKEISVDEPLVESSDTQMEITTQSTGTTSDACGVPGGLSISGITASAALATWSPVSGATSYNVDYKPPTYSFWINIASATTSLQWSLYGMDPNTTYGVRVSANCATGTSAYTETQFTTQGLGSCTAPGGLSASNIASTTATLNWNAVSGALVYTAQYKPTSSTNWITATSGTYGTSVNLYSLSPNTSYDWRVYTNCSLTEASTYSNSQFSTTGSGSTTPVVSACPGPDDISTNGSAAGAAAINLNTDVRGTLSSTSDVDYYKFTISSRGSFTVWLTNLPANYDLAVFNSSGMQMGVSKNKGSKNEQLSFMTDAGTYYIKVFPGGNQVNASSCYTVRVQTVTAT